MTLKEIIDLKSLEWADALSQIKRRSEKREEYLKTFADKKLLIRLKNNDNQIIWGRRGTGKTHLLKALHEVYVKNFENERVIPIFIDLRQIHTVPFRDIITDTEKETYRFFIEFLKEFLTQVTNFIDQIIKKPSLYEKFLGSKAVAIQRKAKKALEELQLIVTFGEPVLDLEAIEAKSIVGKKTESKVSSRLGGEISLKRKLGIDAAIGLLFDSNDNFFEESEIVRTTTGKNILIFSSIQKRINGLLKLLDVCYVTVFVDEWSSLKTELQPKFAELLKHAFLSSKEVCLKIAAIKLRSRMFERRKSYFEGFELSADVFTDIDLDQELLFKESKFIPIHFYESLLFKHLRISLPVLNDFIIRDEEIDPSFLEAIFHNKETFIELIVASNGNPRDFLNIFVHSNEFVSARRGKTSKITRKLIMTASRNWYLKDKNPDDPYLKSLSKSISKLIEEKKIRTFLIKQIYTSSVELSDLEDFRLIHRIPENVVNPEIRKDYSVFLIDYSLCVDYFSPSPLGEKGFFVWTCQLPLQEMKSEVKIENMIIDIATLTSHMETTYQNTCPKCRTNFSIYVKLFKERGLCPSCYEIIDQGKYLAPFRSGPLSLVKT